MAAATIREYYQLTKPGIIRGNILTALAGFMLAAKGHVAVGLLTTMLLGLSCIIGSACVYNNYLDRNIDKKMARTKRRALVVGTISPLNALLFAVVLTLVGSVLLGFWTNALTLGVALFGMIAYVVLYGYAKRHTVHGTLVGSISGAVPPVIGYVAVTGRFDFACLLLFAILVFWQMPHFYAIAMYRSKDYRAAGLPVLPNVEGQRAATIQIVLYAVGFVIATSLLTVYGYAGISYAAVLLAIGCLWVLRGLEGFSTTDPSAWARSMFLCSLVVIVVWCLMVSVTAWLP